MRRLIDKHLHDWKARSGRKPLILRGARQVGKSTAVKRFGRSFTSFVEVNFELLKPAKSIFESDLNPDRIIRELSLLTQQKIIPGETLLFLDEVQEQPLAITALRYFYENMPELHVISAGSLLDFALESVGVPVGRVSFLYLYPMSFLEFLIAQSEGLLVEMLLTQKADTSLSDGIHEKLLKLIGEYLAVGGMPEAVHTWCEQKDIARVIEVHQDIVHGYTQDFPKYAREAQIKYVELIYQHIPEFLSERFQTHKLPGDYRKRELAPAIDLLEKALVCHKVWHSAGHGAPLSSQADPDKYKLILADIAIGQAILHADQSLWILDPKKACNNKGGVVEALIGQELLCYGSAKSPPKLHYWQREEKSSQAEVDYLTNFNNQIIPIEVKSDRGTSLKSLHMFLASHPEVPYGIRFSTHNFSNHDHIHSYPIYAVASALISDEIKNCAQAIVSL